MPSAKKNTDAKMVAPMCVCVRTRHADSAPIAKTLVHVVSVNTDRSTPMLSIVAVQCVGGLRRVLVIADTCCRVRLMFSLLSLCHLGANP